MQCLLLRPAAGINGTGVFASGPSCTPQSSGCPRVGGRWIIGTPMEQRRNSDGTATEQRRDIGGTSAEPWRSSMCIEGTQAHEAASGRGLCDNRPSVYKLPAADATARNPMQAANATATPTDVLRRYRIQTTTFKNHCRLSKLALCQLPITVTADNRLTKQL